MNNRFKQSGVEYLIVCHVSLSSFHLFKNIDFFIPANSLNEKKLNFRPEEKRTSVNKKCFENHIRIAERVRESIDRFEKS